MSDEGIKRLGPNLYHVRVKRMDLRTGTVRNLKRTVEGSKADAQSVRDELRAELSTTAAKPLRKRLNEYAPSWLERRILKDTTRRRYGVSLLNILPALGNYYMDTLTPSVIQDYINDRLRGGAAGYTVLNELRVLRTMAKDAKAERLSDIVFTDRVKAPPVARYTTNNPNRLTPEQFTDVFAALAASWKPMTLLMVTTGLRWGEASALHGKDVRLWQDKEGVTYGEATVRWNNDKGVLVEKYSETKGTERTVPLAPEVVFLMRPLLARAGKGIIFKSRTGKMYASPAQLGRALDKAEKEVAIPFKVTAHGLRRTWKNIAKHHASREVLKAIGGWSTDQMLEHYDHVDSEERMAAARSVIGVLEVSSKDRNKGAK